MAITITNITRIGGTGCRHYRIEANEDGTPRSGDVHVDDLEQEVRTATNWKWALVLLWINYKIKVAGATPASLVGQTVV